MTEHRHRTFTPEIQAAVDRPPTAQAMSVIAVVFRRGEGCCEEDPVRQVTAYYDLSGELLAEHDTWTVTSPVRSGAHP